MAASVDGSIVADEQAGGPSNAFTSWRPARSALLSTFELCNERLLHELALDAAFTIQPPTLVMTRGMRGMLVENRD